MYYKMRPLTSLCDGGSFEGLIIHSFFSPCEAKTLSIVYPVFSRSLTSLVASWVPFRSTETSSNSSHLSALRKST